MSACTHPGIPQQDSVRRRRLGRRAQLLAAASVSYNLLEAVVAITAGVVAGSVALVGFGLDSIVEVSSGLIILWQFRHPIPESREKRALRLMALAFFALAAYVAVEAVRALVSGHEPDPSPVGIGLAAASLLVMPWLSWAQRRTGRGLGSSAVVADSTQTLLCTYLSAVLLAGLVLNATLGWSWADPIAGLVIAAVAVREGVEAWRGEGCSCGPAPTGGPSGTAVPDRVPVGQLQPVLRYGFIVGGMDILLNADACALPTAERPLRLAEFDALFAAAVRRVETRGSEVRLHLSGDAGLADRVRDLAARETSCCSFFTFTVDGTDRDLTLDIAVPPGRQEFLDALAGRARELSA